MNKKDKRSWLDKILGRNSMEYYEEDADFEEMTDEMYDDEEYTDEEYTDEEDGGDQNKPTTMGSMVSMMDMQVDLIDRGDKYELIAVLPGVEEDEVEVDVEREMVTISAEADSEYTEKDGDYLYKELSFGKFSRSLMLPNEVEVDEANAEMKKGVLTVTMPKIDKKTKKKLSVKKK